MLTKFKPAATNKTSQKAKRDPIPPRPNPLFAICDVLLVAAGSNLVSIGQLALLSAKAGEVRVPRRRPQPRSKKYVFGAKIIKIMFSSPGDVKIEFLTSNQLISH